MSFNEDDLAPSVFSEAAFRGRVYGVTGSGHGIGEATIKKLARLGASVVVIDLERSHVRRVQADLESMNARAICLHGDASDRTVLKKAIHAAHKRWGRIDGWVNNPPYNPGHSAESLPLRKLWRTWEVNTASAWMACGLLVPIMKESGGSIVSMSSIMAHRPMAGNAAYGMAKAGVEGMTRGLAVDLAPYRIRVNAVVPGAINTHYAPSEYRPQPPHVPVAAFKRSLLLRQRMRDYAWRTEQPWPAHGEARDAANVILFLLSDAAGFITGACIPVDGGASVCRTYVPSLDLAQMGRDWKSFRALLTKYPTLRMRWMRGHQSRSSRRKK